jgi:prepilin-type N-terminal cleavage/methylation domain-containing protein
MHFRRRNRAFTLTELLVSIAVLTLLILIVTNLVNSASTVTNMGNKRMDADSQARPVLDRMVVDFTQMVKRSDLDYFIKQPSNPQTGASSTVGANDRIAVFSAVPGYYPPAGSQSPVSLVAYRVNSDANSLAYNKLERMGKGLLWNGVIPPASPTPTAVPMVFLPSTISGIPAWSGATQPSPDPNYSDPDYELVGPYVFRFEYYYLLKGVTYFDTTLNQYQTSPSILSDTPWDTRAPLNHTSVNGMQDVTAISVVIAAVDPRSRALIPDIELNPEPIPPPLQPTLAARMRDFSMTMHQPGNTTTLPGDLAAQWQSILDATTSLPRSAVSGIRIYQRSFYLSPKF